MDSIATLPVREAIRVRPLGIAILEDSAGGTLWTRLDASVDEFCRENGLDSLRVQSRFDSLPDNLERQDWASLPLFFLIDHLTAEHRLFRSRDLPEIDTLLASLRLEFPSGSPVLDALLAEFRGFRREFAWHMQEEEEFLFPKILRTEASLRHPDLYAEVYKGSVAMFPSKQWQAPEARFHALLEDFRNRLRTALAGIGRIGAAKPLFSALQGFEARLHDHARLESEVLMSKAIGMEASLLRRND